MIQEYVLEATGICKSFGEVRVLNHADLSIRKGEIHALVGENGAGKSTIIKIISGVYLKDEGSVKIDGNEVHITTPKEAAEAGIRVIHQEINMAKTLTVAENIFLGNYPRKSYGGIDWKRLNEDARKVMEVLGDQIDVEQKVEKISIAEQQMVEIAKALSVHPKILIMDEPTAALNDQETESLFEILDKLRTSGVSIIYITHRFPEIHRLADRATIMRDGETVGVLEKNEICDDTLVSLMIGKEEGAKFSKECSEIGKELFKIENLNVADKLHNVSLSVHQGELVVIFGLVGAGQTELCRAIFGDLKIETGTMWMHGKKMEIRTIQDACSNGIGYVSEDRKLEGIIPLLSVKENICLPSYPHKLSNRFGFINGKTSKKLAAAYYEKLHVKAAGIDQNIGSLSGGNQQKALICRWLANDVKLLILNMPTRGVDVGARAEIYRTMEELSRQGVAVLTISPEMPEALEIADTVYVMHEGKVTARVDRKDATQEILMRNALGIEGEKEDGR